ncbi:predicted protein [Postia placenta Mad-698-R]|uniref:Uncharacterized protein n=1 Tax=Postia placenta MAD-698-R-SB12 TaxID=670580 RepID=A0A1X6MX54_9APHY|nr:hypothetical protein POSPLADRAFT_1147081 [Postia placenta MAD-698-R-SB12]EED85069.1 predicted protein [Postia placenta Mad-698-R]OSX60832.1 hypothetical protein POSPLADRAFT_1147081 [Postia placenta MAD-698-R-SB12]
MRVSDAYGPVAQRDASMRVYTSTTVAPLAFSQQAVLRVYAPPPILLVVDLSGDLLGTNDARDTRARLCTPLSPSPLNSLNSAIPPEQGRFSRMMQAMHITAIESQVRYLRLYPVDAILTRMGAYDNMVPNASTFTLEVELDEWCGLSISLHAILRDTTPHSFVILDGRDRRCRGEWAAGWPSDSESPIGRIVFVGRVTPAGDAYLGSLILPVHYGSLTNDFAHHSTVRNVHMETIMDDEKRESPTTDGSVEILQRRHDTPDASQQRCRDWRSGDSASIAPVLKLSFGAGFTGVGMPRDQPEEFTTSNYGDAVMLSLKERIRHEQYLSEDWVKHKALRAQQSPPPVETEKTPAFSEIVANPDSPVPPIDAVNVQDWLQAVDCSEDQDGAPCPHEDAVSEHFDAAITTEDDRISTLYSDTDTEYSDSVDSDSDADDLLFNADSDADTDAIVEAVLGPFRAKVDDIDVVPLVNYSFDLTEGGECADPRGFIEEAEAMAELIRKARNGTLGDPRAAALDGVVLLAQDVAEGTTTEPGLVHDAAHTNVNSGNPITEHPLNTMETAVERSIDMPPDSSPESKGETALTEAQPF